MLESTYPYYLANEARQPNTDLAVTDKYTGEVATRVALADARAIDMAIAAGCPFVLKPASRTPVGALLIGAILAASDLPPGAFSILPCRREGADRVDNMPYGGVKDSGLGRECIRYAIDDMTEPRLLVMRERILSD